MDQNKRYRYDMWLAQLEEASANLGMTQEQIIFVMTSGWHNHIQPLLDWAEASDFVHEFIKQSQTK